jgi:hypothetical protein
MLSRTKRSIAVAGAVLAAASPAALAASGDPGASPSPSMPQSSQAAPGGGSFAGGYYRYCHRVRTSSGWRWRCVWR